MAEENIREEYVRKDVYEAHLRRIDDRFDALEKRMDERFDAMQVLMEKNLAEYKSISERNLAEYKSISEKNLSEYKSIVGDVKGDIRVLNARLNSLETTVYWGFAIIAFILAFSAFIPAITEFFKNLRAPSLSAADVERMIDAAFQRWSLKAGD